MCCVLKTFKYFITLGLVFSELSDWEAYGDEESTKLYPLHKALRQDLGSSMITEQPGQMDRSQYVGVKFAGGKFAQMSGERFDQIGLRQGQEMKPMEKPDSGKKRFRRTTVRFISRPHYCDYMARPCMHAYQTGQICGRTIRYQYQTFASYCIMEYVNCRENYEVWQMVYVGACFDIPNLIEYNHYVYHDDFFLDQYYVLDDKI